MLLPFKSILLITLLAATAQADYFDSSYSPYSYGGGFSMGGSTSPIYSLTSDARENRNTSLRIAAREDRASDVEQLLNEGAEVNSRSDSGSTALMYAARFCLPLVTRTLLDHNADVNLQDRLGRTALMLAARENCLPVVRLLSRAPGIKLRLADNEKKTAIDYAGPAFETIDAMNEASKAARADQRQRAFIQRSTSATALGMPAERLR